jgi:hypothetical protein
MRSRRKWVTLLIALLLVYVMPFLLLRHGVIASYEDWHPGQRHWLRPVYEPLFYPLRWLDANGWSFLPPRQRKNAGTVVDVLSNRLVLDSGRGYTDYIGFVCEPSVCALLDGVAKGAKIEATFGATLDSGRDRFVNKLLHIRTGEPENRDTEFQPRPCVGAAWALFLLLLPEKDTASWPHTGVFAGYYVSGFEISDFRPAGTRERWWLSGVSLEAVNRCMHSTPCYLVVRGKLSGLGPHGHLSAYKRELTVTEILEQRPLNADEKVNF